MSSPNNDNPTGYDNLNSKPTNIIRSNTTKMQYFKNFLQLGAFNDTQNFIPVHKLRFDIFIGQSKGPVIKLDMLIKIYKQDLLK
ncbi:hypothetical protein HERIO_2068 [Hepatospora eriocheir]|uniref:Uncharacterized protein n=1 Tax=Hepatospora eriocheir TaxID=1081669 RepID=A0A1X0Q8D4_9MICR|nr:hypothetical protein HERIO_2068 [Hepatospora eriocheir]